MKVKSESEVAQLCLTLRDPMDCSLPDPTLHRIFQARVLEWGAMSFSDKEGWAPENLCFQIVVLEKIFESPLDSKEIKQVNPKGNPEYMLEGFMLKLKF